MRTNVLMSFCALLAFANFYYALTLLTSSPIPPSCAQPPLLPCRRLAQRLAAALQARDEPLACQLLRGQAAAETAAEEDPKPTSDPPTTTGSHTPSTPTTGTSTGSSTRTPSTSSRLAWVRDPDSGGYPSHIAAWHGLERFLMQLIETHGEQRGGGGRERIGTGVEAHGY